MDFSEKEIDEYLAFAERALLGDDAGSAYDVSSQGVLADTNPGIQTDGGQSLDLPTSDDTVTPESEHDEILTSANDNAEPLPRGKHHTIYCTNDILGLLPTEYQLVVSQAARWCGVEDSDIATVVERYERRLLRDMERGKKAKSHERSGTED
jgi:RNA polymerase I-specific transcription initiation factor RRN7